MFSQYLSACVQVTDPAQIPKQLKSPTVGLLSLLQRLTNPDSIKYTVEPECADRAGLAAANDRRRLEWTEGINILPC